MLTDVTGIRVGHWTDAVDGTGCTVVVLPEGTIASGEVRGGAPGTREFELLNPTRAVSSIDAVVLSGGSAFGLAAAGGVMRWCEEHGRGYVTRHGRVPIVVGMVIYDLGVGSALSRPRADEGYAACVSARSTGHAVGRVGAGTGATRSKWHGEDAVKHSGLGAATVRSGDVIVSALMVANPIGDIVADGDLRDEEIASVVTDMQALATRAAARENTTIGVVATNVRLDKMGCHLVAQSAHDGIARAIWPAHLAGDGDAIVAVSVPPADGGALVEAPLDAVRALASEAVARAIRSIA